MILLPCWNGNFRQIAHNGSRIQSYKCRKCFRKKVNFADENIRRLSSRRNFTHEIKVDAMMVKSLEVAGADVAQHLRSAAGTDERLLLGHLICCRRWNENYSNEKFIKEFAVTSAVDRQEGMWNIFTTKLKSFSLLSRISHETLKAQGWIFSLKIPTLMSSQWNGHESWVKHQKKRNKIINRHS